MNKVLALVSDHNINEADMVAGGITLVTLLEYLPLVSAGLTAVWVALRIYVLVRDDIFKKGKDGNQRNDKLDS
jgi:hypothetical protein